MAIADQRLYRDVRAVASHDNMQSHLVGLALRDLCDYSGMKQEPPDTVQLSSGASEVTTIERINLQRRGELSSGFGNPRGAEHLDEAHLAVHMKDRSEWESTGVHGNVF